MKAGSGLLGVVAVWLAGFAVAARAQAPFPDVPADHWAAVSVQKLKEAGIVVGYPAGGASSPGRGYAGDKPVTRYELAVTLYRFVQFIERADQQTPKAGNAPEAPRSGREAVDRLVNGGYLPANTPLAADGDKPVTADQLADALSQVIVKATERKTPATPGTGSTPAERPAR